MKKYFIYIILIVLYSCLNNAETNIEVLIESKKLNDNLYAYYLIGETKDTSYIKYLLDDAANPRVSNHINFKGMSVYQCKMGALKKISGLIPPDSITYKPDSSIIEFYRNWALINGFIKEEVVP